MRNDDDDALISEMGMNLINLTHIVQFYIFILSFSLFSRYIILLKPKYKNYAYRIANKMCAYRN